MFDKLAGFIAAAAVVAGGVYASSSGKKTVLYPPGAQSQADFLSRCIKCGKCIEACPWQALRPASLDSQASVGAPTFDMTSRACRLCEDFPCVEACPTKALRDIETRADVNIGYAKIDEEICLAHQGMRCEVCYRVCPLIDEAISIEFESIEGDTTHMKFIPVINKEVCAGCGLCVERCVVRDPHIAIDVIRE